MSKQHFITHHSNLERDETVVREKTTEEHQFQKVIEAEKNIRVKEPVKVICRPLGDRMIVRRLEEEQKGLIIIPGSVKEPSEKGVVVAIGPGRFEEPTVIKEGDVVMFNKIGMVEIEIEGEVFLLMRESDALCIL